MWSGMGLACKLAVAVAVAERTTIVFDLRRAVNIVDDHCMMEDRVYHFSSYILHAMKDCYRKQGYYNNFGIDIENFVVSIHSAFLMGLV